MEVTGHALLAVVLDDLAEGRATTALDRLTATGPDHSPTAVALAAVAGFWRGDFEAAGAWADRALGATGADSAVRALACAAAALAAAGDPAADGRGRWAEGADLLATHGDAGRWWSLVRYLLAEAALVSARLLDARAALAGHPSPSTAWQGESFAAMMLACDVRVAVFSGEVATAVALLEPMRAAVVPGSRLALVVEAVVGLVLGNADDAAGVRTSIEASGSSGRDGDRDFVDRGVLLLLAFGAIAVGDTAGAVELLFRAGDDGDLTACTVIDRALGLEMFLVAALEEEDHAAVETWLAALAGLAPSPIAEPVLRRARGRYLLAAGDPGAAIVELEASIAACRAAGRQVEAAEGEIVLARARIATSDVAGANRTLRALVSASDASGHAAVRRSAASALQPTRRRLPPVAGGGWEVLSEREAEVAQRILAGRDIGEIAAELFLSPATVRSHVSRVLCAFAVPTRIGLLAAAAPDAASATPPRPADVPVLSPRQEQVAALVAAGRGNAQIADELGISVKGVEKHVGDILNRWSVRSRFDLARTWRTRADSRAPGGHPRATGVIGDSPHSSP